MDFEDILLEVGDYGRYQKNLIAYFLVPAGSLLPLFTMNVLFMVSVPEHWCNVPEVASSNLSIADQRSLIAPPGEKCYMYNLNFSEILSNGDYVIPENTTTRPCNKGWVYDHTHFDSTASTKWDLVCDDNHYNSFVLTMFNVGSILGTPVYGVLSDKIGRKITFFITILVTAISAITSVLMTNFIAFVVVKTINGTLMPSVFQLPYIIILELVSPEMRTRMNGIVNCAWTIGLCFLPLVAYFSRGWILLGLLTSSVTLIYAMYWKFLPESPRWLISQERIEEATDIMLQIAIKNGKSIERTSLHQKLQKLCEKLKKEKTVDGVKNSPSDLLTYPQLRKKFLIITICWMADIMAYYGLQLNITNLAGNQFINFFLLALVEFPGYLACWFFMERYGRRWCTVAGFLLTGVACMLPIINVPYMDVSSSMVGKFFAALTFMATYQQSSELYPTVVRSLGMGMSSTVAMFVTLIVPYLLYLSVYGRAIPYVAIGGSCIIAGLLASLLPETLNENLPQSIFEAEDFGKSQKFFSWNRRRRSVCRERAASLGMKIKGFDAVCGIDEKDLQTKRSSQIIQNIEMIPGIENSLKVSDSLKILNGSTKKHSLDMAREDFNEHLSLPVEKANDSPTSFSTENITMADDKIENITIADDITENTSAPPFVHENIDSEKNEAVAEFTKRDNDQNFSYVNQVFDGNDMNNTSKSEENALSQRHSVSESDQK